MPPRSAASVGREPTPTTFRWIMAAAFYVSLAALSTPITTLPSLGFAAAWGPRRPHRGTSFTSLQLRGGRRAKCAASSSTPDAPKVSPAVSRSLVEALLFFTYFGLQSSMSFYMKWILSAKTVSASLSGVPASFLVTATQQLVGFSLFLAFVLGSCVCGKRYRPKRLSFFKKEGLLVLALALSFSLNIGFNNLSLSLVPLSLTMIIRGCSPLSTALTSMAIARTSDISWPEWACMLVGVLCASVVVVAQSGGLTGHASFAFFFGVAVSCASLLSASLDFVFKGILGTNVKLNALDMTCYMALPVAALTAMLGAVLKKPLPPSWAGHFRITEMSDFRVFSEVWKANPGVFGWVLLSGVLAFVYNVFVTFMVVRLSPTTTAFAGNFNKAATTLISLILLENAIKSNSRSGIILGGVIANICAFTTYNMLKNRRLAKEREQKEKQQSE